MRLNHRSAPLRFLASVIGGWILIRLVPVLVRPVPSWREPAAMPVRSTPLPFGGGVGVGPVGERHVEISDTEPDPTHPARRPAPPASVIPDLNRDRSRHERIVQAERAAPAARWIPDHVRDDDASTASAPVPRVQPPSATSAWSGWAYAFVRPNDGPATLAPTGQLGGSQAAARIAYRLTPVFAVAARASAALGQPGREVAVGVEATPRPGLRLTVERRIAADRGGRHAWAAFAAGGFWRQDGALVSDGYAQAGIVGLHAADPFADGALRLATRIGPVLAGGGLWGAAQPGVARVDVGPRLALPIGRSGAILAIEHRRRIAGRARPGSGLAVTLAADF